MYKTLLISLDLLQNNVQDIMYLIKNINIKFICAEKHGMPLVTTDGNKIIFYSRDRQRLEAVKRSVPNEIISNYIVRFNLRSDVKAMLSREEINKNKYVIIGAKSVDFQMAVNNKILFISPTWLQQEDICKKYGIQIENIEQLIYLIQTINNQSEWYSKLILPDNSVVISLTDARTMYNYPNSEEERIVIEKFKEILKQGRHNYYEVLLYHFMSAISNDSTLFRDINDWACFPSSTNGPIYDNEMFIFKELVREMMKCKGKSSNEYKDYPNLLVRHTTATKSQYTDERTRIIEGATKHFNTVCLNPAYKGKLKGRNVCVFDDYLTHGNSFECARNLLRNEGVDKLVFVSLGRFTKPYQYQEYDILGNPYEKDYTYNLRNRMPISIQNFNINVGAKTEVENLYGIFNLDGRQNMYVR